MNKAQSVWIAVIVAIAALALIAIVYVANQETTEETAEETVLVPVELVVDETSTSTGITTEEFSAEASYINLTVAEAEMLAASNDVPFRVVELDGQPLPATMDYRPGRINAKVSGGLVTEVIVE